MSEPRHRAASTRIDYRLTLKRSLAALAPFVPRKRRRTYLATLGVTGAAAITSVMFLPGGQPAAQTTLQFPREPNEAHTQHITLPQAQTPLLASGPAAPADYTVRSGDTLAGIAALLCGTPADFRALAANNNIRYANQISAGDVIKVACHAAAAVMARVQLAPPASPAASGPVLVASTSHVQGTAQQQVQPQSQSSAGGGTLSCSGLEQLWDEAGGNPQDAFMAAEIAMAESGGRQYALSPTDDFGYWQINASNGALATFNPLGNARAAIDLSGNGTNWSAWTTYTAGLYVGRC